MRNPPHPGRILRRRIVPALGLSVTEFSKKLGMSRNAVSRILHEHAGISSDFAVRLEHGGIGEARHWLVMQANYDLCRAQSREQNHIPKFAAADHA
ncbi:HigA family addiction module antidote protein [Pistricoccus aurantiacus]|uniref:HigA family addiction module antidote protein n=2 Tax=Pistricoccus aurantiacus TaxID=1883414 RepID=A0A5B8T1E7_9GAMM|nr:HigA family addiction module antidote protein [Pistricoccus aurantiacus]